VTFVTDWTAKLGGEGAAVNRRKLEKDRWISTGANDFRCDEGIIMAVAGR